VVGLKTSAQSELMKIITVATNNKKNGLIHVWGDALAEN
jgi:hypothetical protein